jgi:hypothetical protein
MRIFLLSVWLCVFVFAASAQTHEQALEEFAGLMSVGFYGASYGFLTDLGGIPLANIDEKTKAVEFLANYQPPLEESKVRIENTKGRGFQSDGIAYKNNLPAVAGHSYAVRAISYDEADTLVAFRVQRKDADGSLIIFWKLLQNFEKPKLIRDRQTASIVNSNFISADSPGSAAKIEAELRKKGFNQVSVDVSTTPLTLRGTVPKGKMAEVVQLVQDVTKKPVRVELTEK